MIAFQCGKWTKTNNKQTNKECIIDIIRLIRLKQTMIRHWMRWQNNCVKLEFIIQTHCFIQNNHCCAIVSNKMVIYADNSFVQCLYLRENNRISIDWFLIQPPETMTFISWYWNLHRGYTVFCSIIISNSLASATNSFNKMYYRSMIMRICTYS